MSRNKPRFLFGMRPWRGKIVGEATNQISEGGNYVVRRKFRHQDTSRYVKNLRGKATNGSAIDLIEKGNENKNFVRFTVDPVTGIPFPARSELAPPKMLDFGTTARIDIEFRIRAQNMDNLTGYVLQFWQPVINPIGGIRVKDGRLEAVTRSAGDAGSVRLQRGWHRLQMDFTPGDRGSFSIDGAITGSVSGRIDGGSRAGDAKEDIFRPKFGWYGSTSQHITVDVRRFVLSAIN